MAPPQPKMRWMAPSGSRGRLTPLPARAKPMAAAKKAEPANKEEPAQTKAKEASTPIARRTRMAKNYLAKAVNDVVAAVSPRLKSLTKSAITKASRPTRTSSLRTVTSSNVN